MQKSIQFFLGVLAGLALAGFVVILSVFLWNWVNPITYIVPDSPVPASSDLDKLAARLTQLEIEQDYQLKVFEWKQDQKLLVLGWTSLFISFVAAFLGLKTYNDLDRIIKNKVNATLEKELYQLDPTMLSIHLMRNCEQEATWKRLELTGLKNLKWHDGLESGNVKQLFQGITIVPIKTAEQQKTFCKFLFTYENELNPKRCAFILAAPPNALDPRVLSLDFNLVPANTPATVASAVLVVGRGLKQDDTEEKPKDTLIEKVKRVFNRSKKTGTLQNLDLESLLWKSPEKPKEEK